MKILLKYVLPAVAAVAISSCTTTMYTTNAVNAPLLKEKGELKINVTQTDLQAAVAVTDNVGIMVNGFYQNQTSDNNYKHFGGMGEVGVGLLLNKENLVFETYVGGGLGKVHKQENITNNITNTTNLGTFDANAAKGFLQSNFGYRTKYFDIALTPKVSFVKYTNFTQTNYTQDKLENDYLDGTRLTGPVFVFAEPAITIRGGYKFIKLQAQYGVTVNLGGQKIRQRSDFASLGLVIDIAKWYRD